MAKWGVSFDGIGNKEKDEDQEEGAHRPSLASVAVSGPVRVRKELPTVNLATLKFKAPAHLIFAGVSGSGKTSLLKNYCKLNKHLYNKVFAFAGSAEFNTDYDWLPKKHVLDPTNFKKLGEIIRLCKRIKASGRSYQTLLIFDDIIGLINTHSGKMKKFFDNLSSAARHYNVSLCFLVQRLTAISPLIRDNAHIFFVTKLHKECITNCLYSHQNDYDDKYSLLNDYSKHSRTPFSSMMIQNVNPYEKSVVFLNPEPITH